MSLSPMEIDINNLDEKTQTNLLYTNFTYNQIEGLPPEYIMQYISLLQSLCMSFLKQNKILKLNQIEFSNKNQNLAEENKFLKVKNLNLEEKLKSEQKKVKDYKDKIYKLKEKNRVLHANYEEENEILRSSNRNNVDRKLENLKNHIDNLFLIGMSTKYQRPLKNNRKNYFNIDDANLERMNIRNLSVKEYN